MKRMTESSRFLTACLLMFALLAATTVVAAAAGLNGTMRTTRTLKAGADECYRDVANVTANESIMVLARNADGSWVFVWSEDGDGWAPTSTVNIDGSADSLPVWTDRFDGEACSGAPVVQFDSRICGREGNVTATVTTRWTDIFSTADPDLDTGRAYPPNTPLTITGRDFWGCWVRVRSNTEAGNGWVPVQAIDTREVLGLEILVDNSGGCQIVDGQITGCEDVDAATTGDIRTVRAATTIYNEPNTSSAVKGTVVAEGRVRVVSERPGWVRITSRYGNGYIQVEQLNPPSAEDAQARLVRDTPLYSEPDTEATTLGSLSEGTEVTVLGFATGWVRVSTNLGEGWVPSNAVARR